MAMELLKGLVLLQIGQVTLFYIHSMDKHLNRKLNFLLNISRLI